MFLSTDAAMPPLRPRESEIHPNDWVVLARHWYPVAKTSEVTDDTPFKAKLLDVDLVLYRAGGGITVANDMCPHRWVRLSAGTVKDGIITCPFHGLSFNGEGACVRVPALGREAKLPAQYRARTFRSAVRYGMIWACLDHESEETIPILPSLEGYDDSAIMFAAVWEWPMSAARQIENFFDLAHLPWIHATTLGGDPLGRINPAKIDKREKSLLFQASFVETVPFETPTECHLRYEVFPPFTIDFTSTPEGGTGFSSANIATPTSAYSCRVFQLMARGEPGQIFPVEEESDFPSGREDGPGIINQQDIDVHMQLRVRDIPLNERLEIHLPVDNVSGAYRAALRDMGLGQH